MVCRFDDFKSLNFLYFMIKSQKYTVNSEIKTVSFFVGFEFESNHASIHNFLQSLQYKLKIRWNTVGEKSQIDTFHI